MIHFSFVFTSKYWFGFICKATFILGINVLGFSADVSLIIALSYGTTHTACLYFMEPVWGSIHNYDISLVSAVWFILNL